MVGQRHIFFVDDILHKWINIYALFDASILQKWWIFYLFKNILSNKDMLCKVSQTFLSRARRKAARRKAALKITEGSQENVDGGVLFQQLSLFCNFTKNELQHRRFTWKKIHNYQTNNCMASSALIFQNILRICKVSYYIIYKFYSSCNVSFRSLLPYLVIWLIFVILILSIYRLTLP